jgi:OOP family OmpA-OmpF porin
MHSFMKKYILLCFVLASFTLLGQSRKVFLFDANKYYAQGDYINALKNYQQTISDTIAVQATVYPYEVVISTQKLPNDKVQADSTRRVPLEDFIHHRIALCYQKTFDYQHAAEHFKLSSQTGSYPEDVYYLGRAQMQVKEYEQALETLEAYSKAPTSEDSLVRSALQAITGCRFALDDEHIKTEVRVHISDTTVFNKGTASFAPMYFGYEERMMFYSARAGGVLLDPEKQQSEFLCDLYWTEKTDDKTWGAAHNFGRPLNSAQHEAAGTLNQGNVVFYTRWSDENREDQAIYLARMIDFKFYEAYKLEAAVNTPGYKSVQPYVSQDGKTLYFSSNRPGGKGGMDLWKIAIDSLGNLKGEAENLGAPVNSESNEGTPFFHAHSSTLFFSSNGHNSIGGLDIFKSRYDAENNQFEIPVNLGMPINSSEDDAYMVWDKQLNNGFFSSDREPCEGGHCYDIYEVSNEPIQIFLDGYVYDAKTDEPIPHARLTFKDVRSSFKSFEVETDDNGYYKLELQQNWELFIKAQKKAYFADAASIDTRPITETTTLTQDFRLQTIPQEEIRVEGIEYDFNSDKLRPESMVVLDKLYDFLVLNNNITVEMNSHTDARGKDIYNLDLSQRRARTCADYLLAKGISADRVSALGYGESKPAVLTDDQGEAVLDATGTPIKLTEAYILTQPKDLQESFHQKNRRTTFKVVSQ